MKRSRRGSWAGIALGMALLASLADPSVAQTETMLYDHVHLAVPDPEAAAKWYLEQFGGEYVDGREDRVLIGTTRLMFQRAADRNPSAGGAIDHLGFSVSDLDAALTRLESAGARVTSPPRDVPGLFRLAFLDDPWGVRLEVLQDVQHLGFHHLHLRSPDPEATLQWYQAQFGGVPTPLRGRLDGILYPGNVWLLVQRGEATPSGETVIDHLGWRAGDLAARVTTLRAGGSEFEAEARSVNLANGPISFVFMPGPDGVRIELVERPRDVR